MQRHKIIHTGVRAFKCQFCGKEFGLLHNMKSHERIHIVSLNQIILAVLVKFVITVWCDYGPCLDIEWSDFESYSKLEQKVMYANLVNFEVYLKVPVY